MLVFSGSTCTLPVRRGFPLHFMKENTAPQLQAVPQSLSHSTRLVNSVTAGAATLSVTPVSPLEAMTDPAPLPVTQMSPLEHKALPLSLTSTIILTVGRVATRLWAWGGRTVTGTQPEYRQP